MANTQQHIVETQMVEVERKLSFLHQHGFKSQVYKASVRFFKDSPTKDEEYSIRGITLERFQLEHTHVLKSKLGRKVKSKTFKGEVKECISFIHETHPQIDAVN